MQLQARGSIRYITKQLLELKPMTKGDRSSIYGECHKEIFLIFRYDDVRYEVLFRNELVDGLFCDRWGECGVVLGVEAVFHPFGHRALFLRRGAEEVDHLPFDSGFGAIEHQVSAIDERERRGALFMTDTTPFGHRAFLGDEALQPQKQNQYYSSHTILTFVPTPFSLLTSKSSP